MNIENRNQDCLVSAVFGTTGVFGDDDEEACPVCSEVDRKPKMSCSDCKKTLVHVHCAHGLDSCPFCRGVNFSEKSSQETQFLLTQYQSCEGPEAAVTIFIELYNTNNNQEKFMKAVNSLDQIIEESVHLFHGFVQRTIACTACIISATSLLTMSVSQYGLLENEKDVPTCRKCLNTILAKDLLLHKEIENFGNFRNFEEITLNTEEGTFLEGALKITKSTRSQFKVRGRICRSADFDRIVGLLKEEEKMV